MLFSSIFQTILKSQGAILHVGQLQTKFHGGKKQVNHLSIEESVTYPKYHVASVSSLDMFPTLA